MVIYSSLTYTANMFTKLIEIWETFLMQLDTEEGETFIPPAGVVASPTSDQTSHDKEHQNTQDDDESESRRADEADLHA